MLCLPTTARILTALTRNRFPSKMHCEKIRLFFLPQWYFETWSDLIFKSWFDQDYLKKHHSLEGNLIACFCANSEVKRVFTTERFFYVHTDFRSHTLKRKFIIFSQVSSHKWPGSHARALFAIFFRRRLSHNVWQLWTLLRLLSPERVSVSERRHSRILHNVFCVQLRLEERFVLCFVENYKDTVMWPETSVSMKILYTFLMKLLIAVYCYYVTLLQVCFVTRLKRVGLLRKYFTSSGASCMNRPGETLCKI